MPRAAEIEMVPLRSVRVDAVLTLSFIETALQAPTAPIDLGALGRSHDALPAPFSLICILPTFSMPQIDPEVLRPSYLVSNPPLQINIEDSNRRVAEERVRFLASLAAPEPTWLMSPFLREMERMARAAPPQWTGFNFWRTAAASAPRPYGPADSPRP